MASVILSNAASKVKGLSPVQSFALQFGAKLLGNYIDSEIFGSDTSRSREGARLETLAVQSSTYGKMIPLVYGNSRIAGNVVWSRPIKEVATTTTTTQGGKGGGGGSSSSSQTDYS